MSHLIKIYAVCPLVFEFSICYSLDLNFFEKFADENFVVCFSEVKELMLIEGVGHVQDFTIHECKGIHHSSALYDPAIV